jgi:hypothetical protein
MGDSARPHLTRAPVARCRRRVLPGNLSGHDHHISKPLAIQIPGHMDHDAADTLGSALAAAMVTPAPAPNQSAHATIAPTRSWTTSSGGIWKPEDTAFQTAEPDKNGFVGRLRICRYLFSPIAEFRRFVTRSLAILSFLRDKTRNLALSSQNAHLTW